MSAKRHSVIIGLSAIFAVLATLHAAQSQNEVGTVSIYVDLSTGFLSAADPKATDLSASIGGVPVPIVGLAKGPQQISGAVLIDTSDSMIPVGVSRAVRRIASLSRAGDTIFAASFGRKVLVSRTPRSQPGAAEAVGREIDQKGGPSPLWDGIDACVRAVADLKGLRAVVVGSDGRATANDLALDDVVARAVASGVVVSVVGLADSALQASSVRIIGRNDGLKRIATETGGSYGEIKGHDDAPLETMIAVLASHRSWYRVELGAAPSGLKGLEVRFRGRLVRGGGTSR